MNLSECKTVGEVREAANRRIRELTRNCTHETYEYHHDDIQGGSYTCLVCKACVSRLPFVK